MMSGSAANHASATNSPLANAANAIHLETAIRFEIDISTPRAVGRLSGI
jgi:hypothetical protein